ncbi:MAG: ABC transporter permease [Nocardioides sp.]|uniref:ABC transporter permease n=1 Tax=Nocardioides sp. TaxID=35761 RepID=UPI0039E4FE26
MSATPTADQLTLDIASVRPVSFVSLVRVELRKMADTRAGLWLLISIGLITALVMVIQFWVGLANDLHLTFQDFMIGMNTPMGILLPVLGILGVTQEWGQRTALVTFTLVPSRVRVLAAKFVGLLVWAIAALIVGLALASLSNILFAAMSGDSAVWGVGIGDLARYLLLHVLGLATGFAFGVLFLNSAVAIVIYFVYSFVLPGIFAIGAQLMDWFAKVQPWIDFNDAQSVLIGESGVGKQWAHLVVSGLLWLALPLVVGVWRAVRAEVK